MIDLSGSLESHNVPHLLVFLSRLGRSGHLRVARGRQSGRVDFHAGCLTSAAFGARSGLDALEALVLTSDIVEFSFTFCDQSAAASSLNLAPGALERQLAAFESRPRRVEPGVKPTVRRSRLRQAAWAAIGLFIIISGAAQLPDIVRQFNAPRTLGQPIVAIERDADPMATAAASSDTTPTNVEWPSDPTGKFWSALDGYHLAPRAGAQFVAVGPPIGAYTQDVLLAGRFRKLAGPPGATYGLVVRDQGPLPRDGQTQIGQFVLFAVTDAGKTVIRRRVGDNWIEATTPSSEVGRSDDDTTSLEVRAVGHRLSFRINGAAVADVDDPLPRTGGVAFYGEGAGDHVLVDQVTITVLQGSS